MNYVNYVTLSKISVNQINIDKSCFVNTFSFVLQLPAGAHLPGMPRPPCSCGDEPCLWICGIAGHTLTWRRFLLWHQTPSHNFMAMFGQNEDECRSFLDEAARKLLGFQKSMRKIQGPHHCLVKTMVSYLDFLNQPNTNQMLLQVLLCFQEDYRLNDKTVLAGITQIWTHSFGFGCVVTFCTCQFHVMCTSPGHLSQSLPFPYAVALLRCLTRETTGANVWSCKGVFGQERTRFRSFRCPHQ